LPLVSLNPIRLLTLTSISVFNLLLDFQDGISLRSE
jgi:hypothetical protein